MEPSMKDIPPQIMNEKGLHRRYDVKPLDGENDPNAVYFVLRLDHQGSDRKHTQACRLAALEFARQTANKELADDLRSLVAYHAGMAAAREVGEDLA
jgi:hypothetical protein